MTVQWSAEILNKFVAPGVADFRSATIPDLRPEFPEGEHWIGNHFLNNVLRGAFRPPHRQYALNFVRRAHATFSLYHAARDSTLVFLERSNPGSPNLNLYFAALMQWEATILNWCICLDNVRHMSGKDLFKKNDGSVEERAYSIHNTIKHHASDITSGKLSGDDSLPFWMTSDGVTTKTHELTYAEFGDLVRDAARLTNELQDVRTFIESAKPAPA
jgi:hypothetical protein